MVIDTSAVIAVLLDEADSDALATAMASDPVRLMSTVNALESAIVIEARKGPSGGREFDLLVHKAQINFVPLQPEHVEEARAGWRSFGKGNHAAGLNFCDCCAYALSRVSGEPLLFKGGDFALTNVVSAIRENKGAERILRVVLQRTYYQQGFFNVPAEYDKFLGPHSSRIEIFVEDASNPIEGAINRTAQRNGTARILGYSPLRDYFRSRFRPGDPVSVLIESPQRIRLRAALLPA